MPYILGALENTCPGAGGEAGLRLMAMHSSGHSHSHAGCSLERDCAIREGAGGRPCSRAAAARRAGRD